MWEEAGYAETIHRVFRIINSIACASNSLNLAWQRHATLWRQVQRFYLHHSFASTRTGKKIPCMTKACNTLKPGSMCLPAPFASTRTGKKRHCMTKACHTLETGSTFLPAPFARTRTGKKGAMPHFGARFNVLTCTIRKNTHWKKKVPCPAFSKRRV